MNFKKQIIAFSVFDLFLVGILGLYLLYPVSYSRRSIGPLTSFFPNWKERIYDSSPYWRGRVFYGFMGKLEVVWREGEACGKVSPPKPVEIHRFPVGTLFLSKASHGYIAGFFFCRERNLYWIEVVSWSRLSWNLRVFEKVIEHLEYRGKPVLQVRVKFKTGWPVVKDNYLLFAASSSGIVLLSIFYLLLFPIFGKCPGKRQKCYPSSMIKFPGKLLAKSRPCCVCFTEGGIVVYTKGYSPITFSYEGARLKGDTIYLPGAILYLNSPPPPGLFSS